jgi:hypothetical protein
MKTYKGFLKEMPYDQGDALTLSTLDHPLAEELEWMCGKSVTVRYWLCDEECEKEEAQENFIKQMIGAADVMFGSAYSEITGFLWVDEEVNVGGHDLIERLYSGLDRWLILEIEHETT